MLLRFTQLLCTAWLIYLLCIGSTPALAQTWVQAHRVVPNLIGPYNSPYIEETVADSAGNVYASGSYSGIFTVGNTTLTNATNQPFGFVGKINPAGQWEWIVGAEAAGGGVTQGHYSSAPSIALDPTGNVVVAFFYSGNCRFGGRLVPGPGSWYTNVFVANLTATGTVRWVTAPVTTGSSVMTFSSTIKLATDQRGNTWVAGGVLEPMTFGTTTVGPFTAQEMFVARLSPAGAWQWVTTSTGSTGVRQWAVGTYNLTRVAQIVADDRGGATILGHFRRCLRLGHLTLTRLDTAGQDLFVARLDSTGTWQWATHTESPGDPADHYSSTIFAGGITVTTNNETWLTGSHRVPTYFGNTPLMPVSGSPPNDVHHGFLARLAPDGQWLSAIPLDTMTGLSGTGGRQLIANPAGGAWLLADSILYLHRGRYFGPFVTKYSPQGTELWRTGARWDTASVPSNSFLWGGALSYAGDGRLLYTGHFSGEVYFGSHRITYRDSSAVVVAELHDTALGLPPSAAGAPAFTLAPNPAYGTVRLTNAPASQAEIIDPLGRVVRKFTLEPGTSNLNLQDLAPGLYVVQCGGQRRRLLVE